MKDQPVKVGNTAEEQSSFNAPGFDYSPHHFTTASSIVISNIQNTAVKCKLGALSNRGLVEEWVENRHNNHDGNVRTKARRFLERSLKQSRKGCALC